MRQCPQCGRFCNGNGDCLVCWPFLEPTGPARAERKTGDCWTVVARFANAAEAGYFANELDYVLGIEPRLDCRDDFDAVHHHWRSGYVVSVPDAFAERARTALQSILDGASSGDREEPISESAVPVGFGRPQLVASPVKQAPAVKWGPLFLTLAAGSLVIWHGKKPQFQRQPAMEPGDALRISLNDAPGLREAPWVQATGGGVRRELSFGEAGKSAVLREDHDGDGVFEAEYALRLGE